MSWTECQLQGPWGEFLFRRWLTKCAEKVSSSWSQDQGARVPGWWPWVGSPGDSHGWVCLATGVASSIHVSSQRCPGSDINWVWQPGAVLHPPQTRAQSRAALRVTGRQTRTSGPAQGRASRCDFSDLPSNNPTSFPGNGVNGHGMQAGSR